MEFLIPVRRARNRLATTGRGNLGTDGTFTSFSFAHWREGTGVHPVCRHIRPVFSSQVVRRYQDRSRIPDLRHGPTRFNRCGKKNRIPRTPIRQGSEFLRVVLEVLLPHWLAG